MVEGERGGFTLIETIIALVLSSIVVILVSGTFLVQSQYYSTQTLSVGVHDNVRVATERVAAEIRSTMRGGFVVAGPRTLRIRSPIALGVICARMDAQTGEIHTEGGLAALDVSEVAGIAVRDRNTGTWRYGTGTWSDLQQNAYNSAGRCADNGADTAWAVSEFHGVRRLSTLFSPAPIEGDVMMLFRETTFRIQTSALDPTTLALFRQVSGQSAVEFATGIDTTAQFQYRTGGSTYADTIASGVLGNIDAVRIVADARLPARSGGQEDITFGWSVNVAGRNLR